MTTGMILRIERCAIHDGPGIRTTVFLKGCPLQCAWCHTPESQSALPEFMPNPDRCVQCGACAEACPHGAVRVSDLASAEVPDECDRCGACARACPSGARELVGCRMGVDEVIDLIEKDRIFYDQSGGGVTWSGGEPLMQPEFLLEALRRCRERRLHTALDTSGFAARSDLLQAAANADLVLFDLKLVDDRRHTAWTGVSNRVILDNLRALARRHSRVIVRVPLVPAVNDDDENIRAIGMLTASLGLPRIDVLPYHRAGAARYGRLNREYRLSDVQPPSRARQDDVVRTLACYGLCVTSGGAS